MANLDFCEVAAEVEIRGELLEVGDRVDVIDVLGHRAFRCGWWRPWPARSRSANTAVGFFGGLLGRVAGEREHAGQVVDVLLADFLEVLVVHDVVVTIGE